VLVLPSRGSLPPGQSPGVLLDTVCRPAPADACTTVGRTPHAQDRQAEDNTSSARLFGCGTHSSSLRRLSSSVNKRDWSGGKNSTLLPGIPQNDHGAIGPMPGTAIIAHSKPNVPRASRDIVFAVVLMRRSWIGSEPIMRPNPTRKRIANAVSGGRSCGCRPGSR
jgi:hypothetical protein